MARGEANPSTWRVHVRAEVDVKAIGRKLRLINIDTGYGLQPFDRTLVFNLYAVYQPKWYQSQSGFAGHLLGGWNIAPIFTTGTGLPIILATINGGGQAFGEGDSSNFFGYGFSENAIPIGPLPSGKRYNNVNGSNGIGTAGYGVNVFADPVATWNAVRQPILGYDTKDGGYGVVRGLNYWNVDLSVKKMFKITERVNTEFQVVFTNLFNHDQFGDPGNDVSGHQQRCWLGYAAGNRHLATSPVAMEFGLRVSF